MIKANSTKCSVFDTKYAHYKWEKKPIFVNIA